MTMINESLPSNDPRGPFKHAEPSANTMRAIMRELEKENIIPDIKLGDDGEVTLAFIKEPTNEVSSEQDWLEEMCRNDIEIEQLKQEDERLKIEAIYKDFFYPTDIVPSRAGVDVQDLFLGQVSSTQLNGSMPERKRGFFRSRAVKIIGAVAVAGAVLAGAFSAGRQTSSVPEASAVPAAVTEHNGPITDVKQPITLQEQRMQRDFYRLVQNVDQANPGATRETKDTIVTQILSDAVAQNNSQN